MSRIVAGTRYTLTLLLLLVLAALPIYLLGTMMQRGIEEAERKVRVAQISHAFKDFRLP